MACWHSLGGAWMARAPGGAAALAYEVGGAEIADADPSLGSSSKLSTLQVPQTSQFLSLGTPQLC